LKTIIKILFVVILISTTSSGQQDSLHAKPKWQKVLYLTGASLLYSGIDYFGYNATKKNSTTLIFYRIFQVAMQGAISWFLYDQLGLPTAIGFNLIWWTFGDDLLYYGYAELVNPGGAWESRGALRSNVMNNHTTWAYWTPIGMARGIKREPIAGDALVAQALMGAAIALTITLTF